MRTYGFGKNRLNIGATGFPAQSTFFTIQGMTSTSEQAATIAAGLNLRVRHRTYPAA